MKKMMIEMTILSVLVSSCAPKKLETSNDAFDPTTATIESATSLISGLADDQAGSSSSCMRAVYNSCESGVKSQTYVSCYPDSTDLTMTGSVNLNYSNLACDMSANGSSVTRTYNLAFFGPHGGEVDVTSNANADYKGNSYGGGGRLTVTPSGWNIDILGKHKMLIYKGRTLYDVSIRTTAPIAVSGSLSRANRVVSSGQLEVNHNIAGFTALFTPSNLQWSNICCHPISGSLNVTWSGSKTGTAVVNFQGCGQAQVDENGQTRDIELSYCE